MQYTCALIAVSDIHASRRFYQQLFGLTLESDYGINVAFTCGLALQQRFHWLAGLPEDSVMQKSHNMELCFEEEDFDGFLQKLAAYPAIERLGEVVEHSWGQRVVRFYDPDGHLIEVGESMPMVVRRFLDAGLSMEQAAKRMDLSISDLKVILGACDER